MTQIDEFRIYWTCTKSTDITPSPAPPKSTESKKFHHFSLLTNHSLRQNTFPSHILITTMKIYRPNDHQLAMMSLGYSHESVRTKLFSRALPTNEEKEKALLDTLSLPAASMARVTTLLSNAFPHQFLLPMNIGGTIKAFIMTGADLDPADETHVLASLSDTMGQAIPVRLSWELLTSFFTGMVRKADADAAGLKQLAAAPDTLFGVPNEAGEREEGTLARLNWMDIDTNDDQPVVVAHPIVFPFSSGLTIPASFAILDHVFPEGPAYAPVRAWQLAFKHTLTHNGGHSVTHGGTLFDPAQFPADTTFPGLNIRATCVPVATDIASLCPLQNENAHTVVVENIKALTNGIHYHLGTTMERPAQTATSTATDSALEAADAVRPININVDPARLLGSMSSKADKEQSLHAADIQRKWEISFGTVDTATDHFIPAKATQAFTEILSKVNKTTALRDLKAHTHKAAKARSGENTRLASYCSLNPDHATSGLVTDLRNFTVCQDKPMIALSDFKTSVSLANMLPIERDSITYQHCCIDEPNRMFDGEYITADTKDQVKGSLYFGRCDSVRDVIIGTVNWSTMLAHFIPGFYESACWLEIKEYLDLLLTPDTQTWITLFGSSSNAFQVNILQDLVQIFGAFFKVGDDPDNVSAHHQDTPIPKTVIAKALTTSRYIRRQLTDSVAASQPGWYSNSPRALQDFLCKSTADVGSASGSSKRSVDDSPSESAKKPKSKDKSNDKSKDKSGKAKDTAKKPAKAATKQSKREPHPDDQKGMLLWAGENGLPPFMNIRAKKRHGDKTKEQLCTCHMTQGFHCNRGKACPRPHFDLEREMEAVTRQELEEHVASPDNKYSWAPGFGPKAGK